jgi:hypothetical protein
MPGLCLLLALLLAAPRTQATFIWSGWARLGVDSFDGLPVEDPTAAYAGMQWQLGADWRPMVGLRLEATLARRGGSYYDQPLSGNVTTIFGRRPRARGSEWLPRVETLTGVWTSPRGWRVQLGLFRPLAAEAITASNKYPNYGCSLAHRLLGIELELLYFRLDLNNRWRLGERSPGEQLFEGEKTRADFFQLLLARTRPRWRVELFGSLLADNTPASSRQSLFERPYDRDRLGIIGAFLRHDTLFSALRLELARNLGRAEGPEGNLRHRGWFVYCSGRWINGYLDPGIELWRATGNRVGKLAYFTGQPDLDDNRAFSIYSPADFGLFDSRYPRLIGPFVLLGSGFAFNYGLPRPGTFGDPHLPDDLRLLGLSLETARWSVFLLKLSWWRAEADQVPVGQRGDRVIDLPRALGTELDLYAEYRLSLRFSLRLLAGIFRPGAYYLAERTDDDPYGIYPRRDSPPDRVVQLELGLEASL